MLLNSTKIEFVTDTLKVAMLTPTIVQYGSQLGAVNVYNTEVLIILLTSGRQSNSTPIAQRQVYDINSTDAFGLRESKRT